MTWIKLDDRAPRHPKVAGLSDRAFRLWIQGMCYASEFLTDGALPQAFLRTTPAAARRELLTAGLWFETPTGAVIHDYLAHQTSRDDIERERARNRRRRTSAVPPVQPAQASGSTAEKPRPENREQRSENRGQTDDAARLGVGVLGGGRLVMASTTYARLREKHRYVGARLRIPNVLHEELMTKLGGDEPDARLAAWYEALDVEAEQSREAVPDVFEFIRPRFKTWVRAQGADAEMAKFLAEGA